MKDLLSRYSVHKTVDVRSGHEMVELSDRSDALKQTIFFTFKKFLLNTGVTAVTGCTSMFHLTCSLSTKVRVSPAPPFLM